MEKDMEIYEGKDLEKYKTDHLNIQQNWNKRDFVRCVEEYLDCSVEKIFAVGGLRGTGKTVGILQAAEGYDVAYLLAQKGDGKNGQDYIDFLKNTEKNYIIIDEYCRIENRKPLDEYLLTAVQNGKRIIITAAESIALDFLNYGTLNHRVHPVHTTMCTYEEYLGLYNKEHSKSACRDFLTEGGLFGEYILKNFDSAKSYMESSIVQNLAGYLKNEMDETKARTLTYAVIYKAICPSNLSSVSTLRENKVTLEIFLQQMGIGTDYLPEEREIRRVADIFEQVGIIVRIPDFCENSALEEQYYISNPSLIYQLIKGVYGITNIDDSILGYIFEASVAVRLFTNKLAEHKIYFYNSGTETGSFDNSGLNIIITDKEKEFAYLFGCSFSREASLRALEPLLYDCSEKQEFEGIEIEGRYIIYIGAPSVKEDYRVGTVVFTPMGNILDNYFEFSRNIQTITKYKQ